MRLKRTGILVLLLLLAAPQVGALTPSKSAESPLVLEERASRPETETKALRPAPTSVDRSNTGCREVIVEKGSSFSAIAAWCKLSQQRLFDANPEVKDPNLVYVGQKLVIPTPLDVLEPREMPRPAPALPAIKTNGKAAVGSGRPVGSYPEIRALMPILADCETGDHVIGEPLSAVWTYDGKYDGGLQFLPSTWGKYQTGYAFAYQAPPEVQMDVAAANIAASSWEGQHPKCTRMMRAAGYNV